MIGKLRVTILGAAVAVSAFGVGGSKCDAQAPGVGASVNANIDVNSLANTIVGVAISAPSRADFTQTAVKKTVEMTGGRYNVMVFNMNLNPDDHMLQGVKFAMSFTYGGNPNIPYSDPNIHIPYRVWVFESGTFVNPGDGGYDNWAFSGSFTRMDGGNPNIPYSSKPAEDGKTVVFHKF